MKKKINRGFVVETNFSPCRCYDKAKYMVFADNEFDLDLFHWTTSHDDSVINSDFESVVSEFGKDGICPTCKEDITFDQHFVVTHQEEETKEACFSMSLYNEAKPKYDALMKSMEQEHKEKLKILFEKRKEK